MTEKETENQSDTQKKEKESMLWNLEMQDVTPLKSNKTISVQGRKVPEKPVVKARERTHKLNVSEGSEVYIRRDNNAGSEEVDRRTAQRLKRGQIPIEGRLDLHGMTQIQAYDALKSFIPDMYHQGKRCILVITGKGASKNSAMSLADYEPGVLKQKTPDWLKEPHLRQYVLKVQAARQDHGGGGALYVLLRRQRD